MPPQPTNQPNASGISHRKQTGLRSRGRLRGAVFCNPPYGRKLGDWIKKAHDESKNGTTIVLLIPARTDTTYFHDYIYGKSEIRFIRGRLKFTDEDGKPQADSRGKAMPAPFPSMVVIYNGSNKRNEV